MIRKANAEWSGGLKNGKGKLALGSGAFEGNYSFSSRFEKGDGTNPEELIGAAHAGCFSMALSKLIEEAGFKPEKISTKAEVSLEKTESGFSIEKIHLSTEVKALEMENDLFQEKALDAKKNCPVSQALTGVEISLEAKLVEEVTA